MDHSIIYRSSPIILKTAFRSWASVLSGALMFAVFPRLNWHPLVWVACLPLLATLVSERSLVRAFWLGYLTGAVFLAGSCYWFIGAMERYGRLAQPLAVGVWLLFVVVFAAFFGAFGLMEGWVARRSVRRALMLSPFLWVSVELARTYLITGFPWNLLGYAVQANGLRQMASVTAVYGLSFLAIATSALLVTVLLDPRRNRWRFAPTSWFVLLAVANRIWAPPVLPVGTSSALLIQPNVPLDEAALENWAPWHSAVPLKQLVDTTVTARRSLADIPPAPPLVIWAENPAPFYFNRDPAFRSTLENLARSTHAYVIVNTVIFAGENYAQPRNSAVVLDPEGRELLQYDKIHLVPFGEYVPWWAFPGEIGKITSQVGDYVPGSTYQVADTGQGKIGVFICYEAIFPQLVRRLAAAGAGVLVNISNDTWYGDSSAAFQHLEMARWRAVENGRYLLRATNDGITVIVDPYGRVVDRIPRHERRVLAGRFNYLAHRTFYTAYGDVFAWLCVAVAAAMVAQSFRIHSTDD